MYIEPCCANRQLPPVANQPTAIFHTNGDVTASKLIDAISHLVPQAICVIMIPKADQFLLRRLHTYLQKGWYQAVLLLTATNQTELVATTFAPGTSLHYAIDSKIVESQLHLFAANRALTLVGPLLLTAKARLCTYTTTYSTALPHHHLNEALTPILPRLRTKVARTNPTCPLITTLLYPASTPSPTVETGHALSEKTPTEADPTQ